MTASAKIVTREELLRLRSEARADGRSLVQCHGCFDIVHPGHVRHLRYARELGDLLLVSITGDPEVRKGNGRPLIPEELRAENLAALDCVDLVYIERAATATDLLDAVRPDVYVKGREYEYNHDPRFRAERETVERHGGRVVFSSGDVVFSSTALIAAMEQSVDPYHARLAQLTTHPELEGGRLYELISRFRGKRVVIAGECVRDTYILCDRPDVAGESPVMTLRPVERRGYDGGAAVLARHIAAMGGRPTLVTSLGDGESAQEMRQRLAGEGVDVRDLGLDAPLPEKQRFLVGAQKVMKVDLLEPLVPDATQRDRLVEMVAEAAGERGGCDAAIIADFGLGLFSSSTLTRLCERVRPLAGVLSGDVSGRRSSLRAMREMDLLTPSESELRDVYRMYDEGLPMVTWRLLEETGSRAAVVTMGADGLIAFDRIRRERDEQDEERWQTRLKSEHVPALSPHAADALGCGDAALAASTLALAGGASLLVGAFLGAVSAACEAQRLGNIPVSTADLRSGVARVHSAHLAYASPEVLDSRLTRGVQSERRAS